MMPILIMYLILSSIFSTFFCVDFQCVMNLRKKKRLKKSRFRGRVCLPLRAGGCVLRAIVRAVGEVVGFASLPLDSCKRRERGTVCVWFHSFCAIMLARNVIIPTAPTALHLKASSARTLKSSSSSRLCSGLQTDSRCSLNRTYSSAIASIFCSRRCAACFISSRLWQTDLIPSSNLAIRLWSSDIITSPF